jgi:hypothetical protein
MNDSDHWIKEELLQAFYSVVNDFQSGIIDDVMLKDRLMRLAERYERSCGKDPLSPDQARLFT